MRAATQRSRVERVPPHDLAAEVAVLGAILQEREALVKTREILKPEHFYRDAHRKIYAASISLFERNEPVDLLTLKNELERRKELEEVGGVSFLTQLLEAVPTAANVAYHASIVREKAILREVQNLALRLYHKIADGSDLEDAFKIRESAQQVIAAPVDGGPILIRLADVTPETVSWLWPGRIPRGKLTLLIGDPGLGKSLLTLDMAAHITRGLPFPDGGPAPQGDVILLTAEDGLPDTVRPRVDALGGNPERVYVLKAIKKGEVERSFNLTRDLFALETAIAQTKAIYIVIDPLSAYLASTDSYRDAEVRRILAPLTELAERTGVAIVGVMHLTKNQQRQAIYRAQGSLAFVAAARAVFVVAEDRDDVDRRLFLPVKLNLVLIH